MSADPIPPLWRRRRKRRYGIITGTALLVYTLTVVLVPPWAVLPVAASEVVEGEPELYMGRLGLGGFDFEFEDIVGAPALLERRRSFTREEQNGAVKPQNVDWGDNWVHHMSAAEIFGDERPSDGGKKALKERETEVMVGKRQGRESRTVHLTFNTCLQPVPNATAEDALLQPPQLQVFVSNSTSNKSPGPDVRGRVQYVVPIDSGFGSLDITATGDIWVGVYAVRLSNADKRLWEEKPPWNYELALSTGEPYHGYRENQFLYLVDADDSTALLVTGNMTDRASQDGGADETSLENLKSPSYHPYTMYAQNRNTTSQFRGLEKSYCAVRQLAQIRPANSDVSMTTRGLGNLPKQQFHLKELNRSSEYWGYLARPRNRSSSDTSGILWKPLQLNTKKDGNCQIIYDLPFCSEVAYAVPSNPTIFGNLNDLTMFYDNLARNWWKNFTYSLQQIQCNASSSAQYSLVRNCDDCSSAYKNWLCAVTIPRCMDYSSDLPYLAERSSNKLFWNATAQGWQKHPRMPTLSQVDVNNWVKSGGWLQNGNQSMSRVPSRNTKIDEIVKPGAYKEIRPCKDLCWTLVQSCPSPLGFSCPNDRSWGKEMSYGERDSGGDVTCSYLGAVYALSSAPQRRLPGGAGLWTVALAAIVWSLS